MIRIYHAKNARSTRIRWLLEELSVPYVLTAIEFNRQALQSPEYLKLHPLGQVPAVEIDSKIMIESGAIVEYLVEQHAEGRLAPAPGTAERAEYLQWFHFGEATLAKYMTEIVRQRFGVPEAQRIPSIIEDYRGRLRTALEMVEELLAGREYALASGFSAADIMLSYGISMAKLTGELPKDLPHVAAYLGRLRERPAYQKAWT